MNRQAVAKKFREDLERTAAAIQDARASAARLVERDREIRRELDTFEECLRAIATDEKGAADRMKLLDRVSKLREYVNMASLGSFHIEVNRAMQAAWERQP